MVIPARKARGAVPAFGRLRRLLSVVATGAVLMGAGSGAMPASADPRQDHESTVPVVIVGLRGDDARSATVLADARRTAQVTSPPPGQASAPVARMLRVLVAIARFNQTTREYIATELSARDPYGAHPVDAQGETVRVTPHALGDLSAQTTTYGPLCAEQARYWQKAIDQAVDRNRLGVDLDLRGREKGPS